MSMPATAAQTARGSEPSMEEILASIRKIIADDQKALERKLEAQVEAQQPAPAAAAPVAPLIVPAAADNDTDGGMLDLATLARLEPAAVAQPVVAAPPAAAEPEYEPELPADEPPVMTWQPAPPPVFEPEPEPVAPVRPATPASPRGLLSEESTSAASASFQSLAHTVFSQNARTMDDLVKEMLRPMLASWLNENLPSLVERLVRAEIERVARGGQ